MFLDAKRVEGCSERTIQYYKVTAESYAFTNGKRNPQDNDR